MSNNHGEPKTETIAETDNFMAWKAEEPDGETTYHIELNNVTLHFFDEEVERVHAVGSRPALMKLKNAITDVRGIEVGHAQDDEALTGCTVILCRKGAVAGVDVRGGAPGTRETDLLNPINLVEKIHAVVLAGGSAFGLDAATGVMRYLEEKKIGFNTGAVKVPIVPSAILYDLNIGRADVRPDFAMDIAPRPRLHLMHP